MGTDTNSCSSNKKVCAQISLENTTYHTTCIIHISALAALRHPVGKNPTELCSKSCFLLDRKTLFLLITDTPQHTHWETALGTVQGDRHTINRIERQWCWRTACVPSLNHMEPVCCLRDSCGTECTQMKSSGWAPSWHFHHFIYCTQTISSADSVEIQFI